MARTRLEYSPKGLNFKKLPFSALRACMKEGYGKKQLKSDILAGILVGIVALPLAMALSIAIGLPPQHGIYTVLIAGFLTPLLGGSRLNVVGPTAAFVVILGPIVHKFGLPGLMVSGMMAGIIIFLMGAFRLGKLIEYIPFPVTTGFTTGIAVVIAGLQLKDAFGIKGVSEATHFPEKMIELWNLRSTWSWGETLITILTLGILLIPRIPSKKIPHWIKKFPAPVIALPVAALAAFGLEQLNPGMDIVTLGERFSYVVDGISIQGIPRSLPDFQWPWMFSGGNSIEPSEFILSMDTLRILLPSALTVALLGAIESLLSAVVADGMARTRHEPDSELMALGLSNFLTPFFGGIPATGAIARTASNYRFGGRTPISAMIHAVTVLLAVLILAPLLAYIPMASMAGLLLLVAWNMSEIEHFIHTVKVAPKSDSSTLIACFLLTVFFDMVIAVVVGVLLGALFFIRRMAAITEGQFLEVTTQRTKLNLPPNVALYSINGPLFFGAAEKAIGALRSIGKDVKVVLFMFNDVLAIDMTGLVAMEGVIAELRFHGIKTIIVAARPRVKNLLIKGGLITTPQVLAYANDLESAMEMVGMNVDSYKRKLDLGPVQLQPLHRQREGAKVPENQQG